MHKAIINIFLCFLIAFVTGCDQSEKGTSGKLRIAVIPKGTTHQFWKSIHAGAAKAEAELDVKIIWDGPLKEDDRQSQIDKVQQMRVTGVAGIVLAPLDEEALVAPVEEAIEKGIPVVVIDSGLKSEKYTSFVASDNYKGGVLAGEHMAKLLNGQGKVAVLRYMEGSASTTNREKGFLDAVAKHPGIMVVSSDQRTGATPEQCLEKSEQFLAANSNADGSVNFDGIFTPCEPVTFGIMKAMEAKKLMGKLKHVGFDASPDLVEGFRNGFADALVVQDPVTMGYEGVKAMVMKLKGQEVEKRIDTGVYLITPENRDEPQHKRLLEPDLKKWLKE